MTTDEATEDTDLPLPDEAGPERTCIVTRAKRPKEDLIRFVLSPDRHLIPDVRAKLPGRGAWILADMTTVALALKRKAFARAFKAAVTVPVDLLKAVEGLLEADALQALAFCNKAGLVTFGATKVDSAIATQPLIGLVHAIGAGEDGIRKLDAALWRRYGERAREISRVHLFTSDQLDLALGRTHVIHAALSAGAVSEGFLTRSRRLERYRGLGPLSTVAARSIS